MSSAPSSLETRYHSIIRINTRDKKFHKQCITSHIPQFDSFKQWLSENHASAILTINKKDTLLFGESAQCIKIFPIKGKITVSEENTCFKDKTNSAAVYDSKLNRYLCFSTHSRFKVQITAHTQSAELAIFQEPES